MARILKRTSHEPAIALAAIFTAYALLPSITLAQQANANAQSAQTAQALARAQGLLRQIGQEKQQLEVDNAKLKGEVASLEKRLRKTELSAEDTSLALATSERNGQRTATTLERTKTRLEQITAKLKEAIARYRETAQRLKLTEAEKAALAEELAGNQRELADAEGLNIKLYDDNREILCLYERKSGWGGLLQREPVTGIKQVAVDNVLEKYQYEMYDYLREANLDQVGELGESCEVKRASTAAE